MQQARDTARCAMAAAGHIWLAYTVVVILTVRSAYFDIQETNDRLEIGLQAQRSVRPQTHFSWSSHWTLHELDEAGMECSRWQPPAGRETLPVSIEPADQSIVFIKGYKVGGTTVASTITRFLYENNLTSLLEDDVMLIRTKMQRLEHVRYSSVLRRADIRTYDDWQSEFVSTADGPPPVFISMFRNPYRRAVSVFYYERKTRPSSWWNDTPVTVRNAELLRFSKRTFPLLTHFYGDNIHDAINTLREKRVLVGLTERMTETLVVFRHFLGWDERQIITPSARIAHSPGDAEWPLRLQSAVNATLADEWALYSFARCTFEKQIDFVGRETVQREAKRLETILEDLNGYCDEYEVGNIYHGAQIPRVQCMLERYDNVHSGQNKHRIPGV